MALTRVCSKIIEGVGLLLIIPLKNGQKRAEESRDGAQRNLKECPDSTLSYPGNSIRIIESKQKFRKQLSKKFSG